MRFFFGISNGSGKKALEQYAPQKVDVMINYAATFRTPPRNTGWLFIDSGGFSFFFKLKDYPDPHEKYLEFVLRRVKSGKYERVLFANRDYPCEPEVRKKWSRTVRDNQLKTVENQLAIQELIEDQYPELKDSFVAVLQGWTFDDYVWMLDYMKDHGLLTRVVGLGTMCRRGEEHQIRKYVIKLRELAPKRVGFHAFGVKFRVLQYPDVREALFSADSLAYQYLIVRGGGHKPIWYQYKKVLDEWMWKLNSYSVSRQASLTEFVQ